MKILTLEGNKVVDTFDGETEPGRFVFLFCENGIFYLDTTIGKLWKLENLGQICEEHAEIVRANSETRP